MAEKREPAADRLLSAAQLGPIALAAAVVLAALWVVHAFLPALVWAAVFAIALWPLYCRLQQAFSPYGSRVVLPIALTLLVGLVFVVPVVFAAIELAHEMRAAISFVGEARRTGIAAPVWLPRLPVLGHPLAEWWSANLSSPSGAEELLGRIDTRTLAEWARKLGGEVAHRLILFLFTLLTLFFLFRDGSVFGAQLLALSHRVLGPGGERIGRHMISAVHGTVNGLVLVGLGEGIVIGIAYALVGLPYAIPVAALTGVLAVIPFGAPLVFGAAGLYLLAQGALVGGAVILGLGFLVVFVADHFIRPALIGGAVRLPFLWVLLGLLGGLETFGLLGLFLGPAIMAALISLWRDWTGAVAPAGDGSRGS